ncbi:MAG: transglutaminase-like domain-containing protein, partial [Bacteroidota bacterium]
VFMFRKGFTYALLYDEGDDRYIPPMKGHFYDIVNFWNDFPVITKYYETNIPSTKTVCYKFFNGTPDSLITRGPEKTSYSFTMRDMKPYKHEPQMVALSDVAPKLLISTSPDWESKSMWFYGVNEDYGSFESTPAIDKKVAEILEGAGDEMDSISRLTHWVADNIRYSGISMGKGEGYTLHKGEMNFTDRCGVCKDKAGMLVTMLRAAGFDSYAAMTMAGSRIDDIPADQFNHSVTVVRLHNGEYKMLDPTWVPFLRELWSSREQQQNYLMGLPEGADLMEIPISPPENHYIKINGTSSVLKNGTIEGELVIEAEGQSDANIRSFFTRSYKADWGKLMEEEFLAVSPQFKIKEIQYPENPYDYSEPIKISVKYTINDYATVTDEEIIFIPVAATELFKKAMGHMYFETENETREFPFKDRCSQMVEITETVSLPGLTEAVWLPVSESIQGTGGSFYGGYELDGNKLVIHEKALFPKRVYEPEDWDSYRSVVIARKKFAKENVILKFK